MGKKIEDKIGITWKGCSFDVWISEFDEIWAPSFITKANVSQVPGTSADQASKEPEKQNGPDTLVTPVNSPAKGDTAQKSPGEHEKSVGMESAQETSRDVEKLKKSETEEPEEEATVPEATPTKEVNIGGNPYEECINTETNLDVHVTESDKQSSEFGGPAHEVCKGLEGKAQKKEPES
ncbi:hypothetical protein HanRHA438_Chr03g0114511 [Helianthus annuus]|nr:hypothetical protein HanRHA438_Chr03g0114511 [Helianthus annuus]